jgi:hypothetical protein
MVPKVFAAKNGAFPPPIGDRRRASLTVDCQGMTVRPRLGTRRAHDLKEALGTSRAAISAGGQTGTGVTRWSAQAREWLKTSRATTAGFVVVMKDGFSRRPARPRRPVCRSGDPRRQAGQAGRQSFSRRPCRAVPSGHARAAWCASVARPTDSSTNLTMAGSAISPTTRRRPPQPAHWSTSTSKVRRTRRSGVTCEALARRSEEGAPRRFRVRGPRTSGRWLSTVWTVGARTEQKSWAEMLERAERLKP